MLMESVRPSRSAQEVHEGSQAGQARRHHTKVDRHGRGDDRGHVAGVPAPDRRAGSARRADPRGDLQSVDRTDGEARDRAHVRADSSLCRVECDRGAAALPDPPADHRAGHADGARRAGSSHAVDRVPQRARRYRATRSHRAERGDRADVRSHRAEPDGLFIAGRDAGWIRRDDAGAGILSARGRQACAGRGLRARAARIPHAAGAHSPEHGDHRRRLHARAVHHVRGNRCLRLCASRCLQDPERPVARAVRGVV